MDFSHSRIALTRNPLTYSKMRPLVGAFLRHWPIRKRARPGDYLNIGAGPHSRRDFFNVDFDYHPGIDLFWDLRRPLPIAAGTIAGAYSEHCLEHLSFEVGQRVLSDLHRVLAPGATVRIVVPDGGLYAAALVGAEPMPFSESQTDPQWTPMRIVNSLFYGHGHRFIYDYETLAASLARAGFAEIGRAAFREGRDPRLLIDQPERACESLYVEAVKDR